MVEKNLNNCLYGLWLIASGAWRLRGYSPSACRAPKRSEETGPIPDCSFYLAVSLSRDATVVVQWLGWVFEPEDRKRVKEEPHNKKTRNSEIVPWMSETNTL